MQFNQTNNNAGDVNNTLGSKDEIVGDINKVIESLDNLSECVETVYGKIHLVTILHDCSEQLEEVTIKIRSKR